MRRISQVARSRTLLLLISLILSVWTIAKGFVPGLIYPTEIYFWMNTYEHGYVRRGLVGTLLSPFFRHATPTIVYVVGGVCHCLSMFLLVVLTILALRRAILQPNTVTFIISILFVTSPFLGLIAHHTGYPDSLLAVLIIISGMMIPQLGAFGIAILLVMVAMVHELIFFLLVPMTIFHILICQRFSLIGKIVISIGIIFPFILFFIGSMNILSDADLIAKLVGAGVVPMVARNEVKLFLHQGMVGALLLMKHKWAAYSINGIVGALYFSIPAIFIMIVGFPTVKNHVKENNYPHTIKYIVFLSYIFSCLGALILLSVAFDLSRIASFTTLTAFVTATCLMGSTFIDNNRFVSLLAAGIALCFTGLPICNLYFDYGREINLRMIENVCPPCAASGVSFIDFFNRDLPTRSRAALDSDNNSY